MAAVPNVHRRRVSVPVDPHRPETLAEVRRFLAAAQAGKGVEAPDRMSAYRIVEETLTRFRYHDLPRPDKGVVLRYLERMTGRSAPQIQRYVRQHRETGLVRDRRGVPVSGFKRRYTNADIRLLADVDGILGHPCGDTTRAMLRRIFEEHGDERFERLARISNGHLYNLRRSAVYRHRRQAPHSVHGSADGSASAPRSSCALE